MTWSVRVVSAIALAILVPVAVLTAISARPLAERWLRLYDYVLAPPPPEPRLTDALNEKVRERLIKGGLPPEFAGRLVFQEVPPWYSLGLDDPGHRMETLRRVADGLPVSGAEWQDLGRGLRDSYLLFLGALTTYSAKREALDKVLEARLAEFRERRKESVRAIETRRKKPAPVRRVPQEHGVLRSWLDQGFHWLTPSPDQTTLSHAFALAWQTTTPNPQDNYSLLPPLSQPLQAELDRWLAKDTSLEPQPVATARVADSGLLLEPAGVDAVPELESLRAAGEVVATLHARDWELFRLRRSWLNESLLERYRRDWNPALDVAWMFEEGGPLSQIPIAVVVARDLLYQFEFTRGEDLEAIDKALNAGHPVRLDLSGSILIVEPGAARVDLQRRLLSIPPAATRGQIVSVISLRY